MPQTLGQKIRGARLAAGMTQTQLAHAVSTSERNIVRWETDSNAPRFAHVAAIARATDRDVAFFEDGNGSDDEEEGDPMTEALLDALMLRLLRRLERQHA